VRNARRSSEGRAAQLDVAHGAPIDRDVALPDLEPLQRHLLQDAVGGETRLALGLQAVARPSKSMVAACRRQRVSPP
jgi:hypothetical protein